MKILGIHTGHDAGAALIEDGKIIRAANEERFTRIKHWGNGIPQNSLGFVLQGIELEDLDAIAVPIAKENFLNLLRVSKYWFKTGINYPPSQLINKIFNKMRRLKPHHTAPVQNKFPKIPIFNVEHHVAHAASAYYLSGLSKSLVLTLDGVGDLRISGTVNMGEKKNISTKANIYENTSLGHFYEAITDGLGFKINDHEYKIMGLASYGKPVCVEHLKEIAPKVFGISFYSNKYYTIYSEWINNFWAVHIGEAGLVKLLASKYKSENVAASGQKLLEDLILRWVNNCIDKFSIKDLSLSGGVFLNVKANKRIREELKTNIYPHPNAGDGGLAVGAALYAAAKLDKKVKFEKMEHVYFGPEYLNEEILKEIKKRKGKYTFSEHDDIAVEVAKLLAEGKVIGWFQGKMEYGPRALGSRSVLADPRDVKIRERINNILKQRDWFMPFAPSMLRSRAKDYLKNPGEAPFMILAFDATKECIKDLPAAVHVDNTTRPQLVEKETNPLYHSMIKEFENITGVGAVLNTSFNKHGLPIVCSPSDALDHLDWGCVDTLAIGNYMVFRK